MKKLVATTVLGCALGVSGCSSDAAPVKGRPVPVSALEGSESQPPAVPACSSGRGLRGTYTVPVPEALSAYATFPLEDIQFCEDQQRVTLSYKLPSLLVGEELRVSFRGGASSSLSSLSLAGNAGTAICRFAGTVWSCQERLDPRIVDAAKLDQELRNFAAAEAIARRQVASLFGQDPIGVVRFSEP